VSEAYDRRVVAARADLAAAHLKGRIKAERYSEGRLVWVTRGRTALRGAPSLDAALETELLFGEGFTIYDDKDGWVWGQAALDSHVGYARSEAFSPSPCNPSHRVTSARGTPLLSAPDPTEPAREILPLNAKLELAELAGRFAQLKSGGYVFQNHIAAVSFRNPDWVSVTESLVGVPYVWGGKSFAGIDCSGLIQTALEAGGVAAPRDTDLMEAALGVNLALDAELKRGDLIFWKGHMGTMLDAARLIHANAYAMQVSVEPFKTACERIAADGFPVRTVKRLS